MHCYKKNECANYNISCLECQAMSSAVNAYPRYSSKMDHKNRLMDLFNSVPDLFNNANRFPWKMVNLVDYLVENGVRVEEDYNDM